MDNKNFWFSLIIAFLIGFFLMPSYCSHKADKKSTAELRQALEKSLKSLEASMAETNKSLDLLQERSELKFKIEEQKALIQKQAAEIEALKAQLKDKDDAKDGAPGNS